MTKSLHGRRGKRLALCHNSLIKPDFWGAAWTEMGYGIPWGPGMFPVPKIPGYLAIQALDAKSRPA